MEPTLIQQLGDELYDALRERTTVAPLTDARARHHDRRRLPHLSCACSSRRLADGERVIGKKIGVTSKAVQNMLGVHQPDFGYLTTACVVETSGECRSARQLIQPRAEGEIAFVLQARSARARASPPPMCWPPPNA